MAPPLRSVPRLAEAKSPVRRKLDLGCGSCPKDGFEGVDLYAEQATHKVDLFKFPWAFEDESVAEIHCSHFLEHVPAREVEERDLRTIGARDRARLLGQDMLFAFVDECWRVLVPAGWMHVVVPSGRSSRAFQDPTHRRFFMQETFLYFTKAWRDEVGLSHYRVRADFAVEVGHMMDPAEGLRSADAQRARFEHYWNTTLDWVVRMKKLA